MRFWSFNTRSLRLALALVFLLASNWAMAQVCATPQKDGSKTSGSGEVINGYYTPAIGNYIAGSLPTIALSNARGTTTVFAQGDMALIIQMQCVGLNMTDTDSYAMGWRASPVTVTSKLPAPAKRVSTKTFRLARAQVPAVLGQAQRFKTPMYRQTRRSVRHAAAFRLFAFPSTPT